MPVERFKSWLAHTRRVQTNVFGYNFPKMWAYLPHTTQYLMWNVFAAQQELAELAVEFSWKPWAVDEPFVNRERIIDEAVDVLHFVGNILVAVNATDEELNEAYEKKVQLNIARKTSGTYSAQKGGLGDGSDQG